MEKLNVCVIFGGVSTEHDVSKLSAKTVLLNIDYEKYNVYPIYITKSGSWRYFEGKAEDTYFEDIEKYTQKPAIISPDKEDKAVLIFDNTEVKKIKIDVCYPVLHGKNGEDGSIQGLFQLAGIPYAGSGIIGSAVCMDKCVAKILFEKAGINQANWVELKAGDELNEDEIIEKLGLPLFVKPSSAGSSYGVTKVSNKEELKDAVCLAFSHDYKVLIEEAISAREVEISVMGNLEPEVSDYAGEILPAKEFYDFDAKYIDEGSKLLMPAPIDDKTLSKIKEYAKKAYKICECRGFSRVDFFVEKETGEIYLNEINTLPGFTQISMYPKLWALSGKSIKDVITEHIELARKRID